MQIPSTLIIQHVRPSYWLGFMEIGWGAFTFAQAGMNSYNQLYAFRFLQAAVYDSLDGVHGIAGWRWLYLICGCMTVPVGLVTFFFLPDTPHKTRAWFLTQDDKDLALRRVEEAGKAAPASLTWSKAGRILRGWKWWLFVLGYVWGFLSDYTGSRVSFVLAPLIYGLLPTGILAFWPSSLALKEFAFLTAGVQLMTAVFYTWASEVCADDNEERALVIGSMNGFQYAVAAWLPIVTFPQLDAPTFRKGFPSTFGLDIAAIVCVLTTQWFVVRNRKQKTSDAATSNHPSSTQEARSDNYEHSDDKMLNKDLGITEIKKSA
ncbi:hypothetical protein N0V82_000514 [Gnomoniopsis sp. IMI 355080]|nr:hypothetical protein N0V82_000514 [Gnomoniopsis sp. IMI 355080]